MDEIPAGLIAQLDQEISAVSDHVDAIVANLRAAQATELMDRSALLAMFAHQLHGAARGSIHDLAVYTAIAMLKLAEMDSQS